jgi:hypothetical protein
MDPRLREDDEKKMDPRIREDDAGKAPVITVFFTSLLYFSVIPAQAGIHPRISSA